MKNKYCFTAVLLLVIAVCAYLFTGAYMRMQPKEASEDLTVVTSFYPMYIATVNVVGDCEGITVKNLSEPQTGCLHDFQLTPEDMKLLSTADVFVVNGGGMESFLVDVAEQYPELAIVEAMECEDEVHSREAEEEHEEEASHVHEHTHNHENAHVWMSVKEHREQIAVITTGLCEVLQNRPNASEYETTIAGLKANAAKYDARLADLETQQEEIIKSAAGSKVISFHESYEYIAEDYGLNLCYTLNLDEERQVSAGEVADVLEAIRENDVKVIFAEELYGRELADTILKEADVKVYYLDTLVRGDYNLDSYINGMQENIHILQEAFGVN